MLEPFPDFSAAEMHEIRRMNGRLRWTPRFRAPSPLGRMMIQSMLGAQAFVPIGTRGLNVSTRRITHMDHTVTLRILRPRDAAPRAVYIDYHGGGWSIGTASMDDLVNGAMARKGIAVVSVDYTTLPDITFENQIAQCHAAADWVFDHAEAQFGTRDLFIGGESAGAHLAACATLRLRDTRKDFARLLGVSVKTLQKWEQDRRRTTGPAAARIRRRAPYKHATPADVEYASALAFRCQLERQSRSRASSP